jgi:hypothetical protein
MKNVFALLTLPLRTASADAALVLTVDASAKTVAWSGAFTTNDISTGGFEFAEFYLANSQTSNPNPSPLKTVSGTANTLTAIPTGFDNVAFNPSNPGVVLIVPTQNIISSFIAGVVDFNADTYTFTVSILDGGGKSYADFTTAEAAFLGSLDGVNLILVRRDELVLSTIPIAGGGPAATISIVPEPSTFLLGALGSLALLRRRR